MARALLLSRMVIFSCSFIEFIDHCDKTVKTIWVSSWRAHRLKRRSSNRGRTVVGIETDFIRGSTRCQPDAVVTCLPLRTAVKHKEVSVRTGQKTDHSLCHHRITVCVTIAMCVTLIKHIPPVFMVEKISCQIQELGFRSPHRSSSMH